MVVFYIVLYCMLVSIQLIIRVFCIKVCSGRSVSIYCLSQTSESQRVFDIG